jgi:hypothetical protein
LVVTVAGLLDSLEDSPLPELDSEPAEDDSELAEDDSELAEDDAPVLCVALLSTWPLLELVPLPVVFESAGS